MQAEQDERAKLEIQKISSALAVNPHTLAQSIRFLGKDKDDSKPAQSAERLPQGGGINQPVTLEEYVRDYFENTPVLAEIAKCESHFRHLGTSGRVIRGEVTTEDVGVMQINEFYHEERAKMLGLDLHTLDGNLAYAKWLYRKEGTVPWSSSSRCWQKADTLAKADAKTVAN